MTLSHLSTVGLVAIFLLIAHSTEKQAKSESSGQSKMKEEFS